MVLLRVAAVFGLNKAQAVVGSQRLGAGFEYLDCVPR